MPQAGHSIAHQKGDKNLQNECIGITSSTVSGEESAKRQCNRVAGGPRHPAT